MRLEEALVKWKEAGLDICGLACDVASEAGRSALEKAVQEWSGGVLHVCFLNAGKNIRKATIDYTRDDFDSVMGLNLNSTYILLQHLYPMLVAAAATTPTGASIIFNSSVAGLTGVSSGTVYAMSKAALNQLAKNLACEWGRQGLRVNTVCPWYTDTPLAAPVLTDANKLGAIIKRTPLGRVAEASEVADCVVFLALPASSYVTGQSLVCDGGFTCAGNYVF